MSSLKKFQLKYLNIKFKKKDKIIAIIFVRKNSTNKIIFIYYIIDFNSNYDKTLKNMNINICVKILIKL